MFSKAKLVLLKINEQKLRFFLKIHNLKKEIEKTVASLFIPYACRLIYCENNFGRLEQNFLVIQAISFFGVKGLGVFVTRFVITCCFNKYTVNILVVSIRFSRCLTYSFL
jgi:hypothetical protein